MEEKVLFGDINQGYAYMSRRDYAAACERANKAKDGKTAEYISIDEVIETPTFVDVKQVYDCISRGDYVSAGNMLRNMNEIKRWPKTTPTFGEVRRVLDYFERNADTLSFATLNKYVGIKQVIFNAPATIVIWYDGTKTVVKAGDGDVYDPEKGLAMAIAKKALGNKGCYYDTFKKWLPKEEENE